MDGTITSYPCFVQAVAQTSRPLTTADELADAAGNLIPREESPRAMEGLDFSPSTSLHHTTIPRC